MGDRLTAYLAAEGFERELVEELGAVEDVRGRLVICAGPPRPAAWAQNVWLDPERVPIRSITDGARKLRAIQRNWVLWSVAHHRRARLIQERLPAIRFRPLRFGDRAPSAPLGSWTLLAPDLALASARCASAFPHGEVAFVEDHEGPPSRAYLKLWEALTLLGVRPAPGERCLDLGSSPGAWTWALAGMGARVLSVDKAPLAPSVAALEGVEFRRASAFSLDPGRVGPVDWLFSDVICYPARLLGLVTRWLGSGLCRRFVCTLKFQGETDHATAQRFAAIPGSRLMHLSHNRHELTWVRIE